MGGDTRYIADPSTNIRSLAYNQDGSCLVVTSKNFVSVLNTPDSRMMTRLKTRLPAEHPANAKDKRLNITTIKSVHLIGKSQYAVIVGNELLDPKFKDQNVDTLSHQSNEENENGEIRRVHLDNHVLIVRDIKDQQTMSYFVSKEEILNVQLNQHVMFVLTRSVLYILNPLTMEQLYGYPAESAHKKGLGWDNIHNDPTSYKPGQIPSTFVLTFAPIAFYQNPEYKKPIVEQYEDVILEKHVEKAWTVVFHNNLVSSRRKRRGMNLSVMNSGWARPIVIKKAHEDGPVGCVALSIDGSLLASCSIYGKKIVIRSMTKVYQIGCCELGNSKFIHNIEPLYEFARGSTARKIHCLAFSPNSHFLAAISDHGTLHIFSLHDTKKNRRGYASVISNDDMAFTSYSGLDTQSPSMCKFLEEHLVHVVSGSGATYLLYFNPINGQCHLNRSGDLSKYI